MKFIRELYAEARAAGKPLISFEFFSPKSAEGESALLQETLPRLQQLNPGYFSVTYGAGGSTRERTLSIADRIQKDAGVAAMAHLTCVGSTREEIASVIEEARGLGICNLLALRGDPPGGGGEFRKTEGGFQFAHELVSFIRERGGFCIGTAGFPEGHLACLEGKYVDWARLKMKIDAGSDFVLTQLFFDNADFFEFRDHLVSKLGVNVPIVPGIIPILGAAQIKRFTTLCGAKLPGRLQRKLEELAGDDEAVKRYGIEYATEQCRGLLAGGVEGLHFYTLNKAASTEAILRNL